MANKQANVAYRDSIQTNEDDGSTTVVAKKVCNILRDALMQFNEHTKRRDPQAELISISSQKARKANKIEIEITFFCKRPTFIRLQKANPNFHGYGRWA